jgi:muramidase (phage lysozyme)
MADTLKSLLESVDALSNPGSPPDDGIPPLPAPTKTPTPADQAKARAEAEAALKNPNVSAFLDTIAWAEGARYDTLYGGARFDDYSRFPGYGKRHSPSGRYQIVAQTYDELSTQLGLTDFSPRTQDLMAVHLLHKRGALKPLLSGDLDAALPGASRPWASLPKAPGEAGRYNQPYKPYEAVRSTFERLKSSR